MVKLLDAQHTAHCVGWTLPKWMRHDTKLVSPTTVLLVTTDRQDSCRSSELYFRRSAMALVRLRYGRFPTLDSVVCSEALRKPKKGICCRVV